MPALVGAGFRPALIQTRGRTFLDYMNRKDGENSYEVDTVLPSGEVATDKIECHGAFTMGSLDGQKAVEDVVSQMKR